MKLNVITNNYYIFYLVCTLSLYYVLLYLDFFETVNTIIYNIRMRYTQREFSVKQSSDSTNSNWNKIFTLYVIL